MQRVPAFPYILLAPVSVFRSPLCRAPPSLETAVLCYLSVAGILCNISIFKIDALLRTKFLRPTLLVELFDGFLAYFPHFEKIKNK
jgi:hypothetical protein